MCPSSVSWKITPLSFFSSSNMYFAHKGPIKKKIFWEFRVLESNFVEFPMPILKRRVNSPAIFVFLFNFTKKTLLYFFRWNNIYFSQNEPIKLKILETFKCSGQILSNSLCQFWNQSIPLQIFYPSSVSWKITPR